MKKTAILPLLSALALLLTGCDRKTTLFAGLEERQANAVIASLMDAGYPCQKTKGEEGTWNVLIMEKDFADATALLDSKGLPHRIYMGVGDVFKKTGMVSSPSEERIRFMDALAQDLSRTISTIDGVVDARVHVVLPENDPFAKNAKPSSAAVAIRHRSDIDMADMVPQIKSLVKNAIEGLTYDKISVVLFCDNPPDHVSSSVMSLAEALIPKGVAAWFTPRRTAIAAGASAAALVLSVGFFIAALIKLRSAKKVVRESAEKEEDAVA